MLFDDDDESFEGMDRDTIAKILDQIRSGSAYYIDVDDVMEAYDFLVGEEMMEEADEILEYGLKLHGQDIDLQILKTNSLIDKGKFAEAAFILDDIYEKAQNKSNYYFSKGYLRLRQEDLEEAEKLFRIAIAKADDDMKSSLTYEIGMNLNHLGLHKEAISFFEMLPEKEIEGDEQTEFEYAYALEKVGRAEDSQKRYEHLVETSPLSEGAWYNLGILYSMKGDFDNAIEAYQNAIALKPDYAEPYYNMANAYLNKTQIQKALDAYLDYATYARDEVEKSVYNYIGECWTLLGNEDYAKKFFLLAIKLEPESDSAWYNYGRLCADEGEYEDAKNAFERAIELRPEVENYYFEKAQIHYNLHEIDETIDMLERGIKITPNNVLAWFEVVRIRMEDTDALASDIRKYIKQKKEEFGNPSALQLVEAYVEFFVFGKKNTAKMLMRNVASSTPQIIKDASIEPNLHKLLERNEIIKILNEYNIKF